jgi:hypothetical protein
MGSAGNGLEIRDVGLTDHSHAEDRRAAGSDLSWMLWTAIGIGGIWVAVLLLSLLAPDMVSGSEQDHLPLAAFTTWFWGGVGTLAFLWVMGRLRGSATWQPIWIGLSVAVALVLSIGLTPTLDPRMGFTQPPHRSAQAVERLRVVGGHRKPRRERVAGGGPLRPT